MQCCQSSDFPKEARHLDWDENLLIFKTLDQFLKTQCMPNKTSVDLTLPTQLPVPYTEDQLRWATAPQTCWCSPWAGQSVLPAETTEERASFPPPRYLPSSPLLHTLFLIWVWGFSLGSWNGNELHILWSNMCIWVGRRCWETVVRMGNEMFSTHPRT